jgi:hypothetical protein
MHLNQPAHELFARQHGIASLHQLHACGYTSRQVRRLVDEGAVTCVLRGAYRSPSVPFDEVARCAAVCLAHPDIAVAGPTAGRLWGYRRLPRDHRIHVVAPPASNPAIAPWVLPYRTAAIHDHDVIRRDDGIRLTSRARTAFDLTRWLGPDDLLSVIEQAMHDGKLGETEMWSVAVDWVASGRPWVRKYLRQLGRRLHGGAAESHPEVRVATALALAGVHGLVRQFAIELPGYGAARFDLAVPDLSWAIEIDVHPRHQETAGAASDVYRDHCAGRLGWSTSRVSRAAYLEGFEQAIDRLVTDHRRLRQAHRSAGR